ncbi:MAG: CpsB/CapC family capsule biosynthesis tyrosine phosphatase [Thermodesulfobacteriota bacterium]|nr:CpsB/CapC family capsule biosynthesis tyrosine phosphatase [Thermodesulfobacteriota bacterium]
MHFHILPGLDDGPDDIAESVRMCRIAADDGIHTIVATPHMLKGIYNFSKKDVLKKVEELNSAIKAKNVPLTIFPGAEVVIVTRIFLYLIHKGDLLTMNNCGSHVILELTDYFPKEQIENFIKNLIENDMIPIISHPERNITIQKNITILSRFVKAGALSQITAMSITGDFGTRAQKISKEILKSGLAHVIATDAHSSTWRPPILSNGVRAAKEIIGEDKAVKMVTETPRLIIQRRALPVC